MSAIDIQKVDRVIQELAKYSEESRGFIVGVAAIIACLPGVEKVSASAAKREASKMIGVGFGAGAISSRSGKMIDLICGLAKEVAALRPTSKSKSQSEDE